LLRQAWEGTFAAGTKVESGRVRVTPVCDRFVAREDRGHCLPVQGRCVQRRAVSQRTRSVCDLNPAASLDCETAVNGVALADSSRCNMNA
jgi:hypothetical protein